MALKFEINSALRVTDAEADVLETWLGKQLVALFDTPLISKRYAAPDNAMDSLAEAG